MSMSRGDRNELARLDPLDSTAVAVKDEDNPRSIVNIVSDRLKASILRVPDEYLNQDPDDLLRMLKKSGYRPSATDNRLRLSFWREYERAQDLQAQIVISNVHGNFISRQYFYFGFATNPKRLAWMLTPPLDYALSMEEALLHGVDRIREILDMPLYNKAGAPDPKVAGVIIEAVKVLDTRVKGAVIQKIAQTNLHVNVDKSTRGARFNEAPEDMETLNKRLGELEREARGVIQQDIEITNAAAAAASDEEPTVALIQLEDSEAAVGDE